MLPETAADNQLDASRKIAIDRALLFLAAGVVLLLAIFYWPFLTGQQTFYYTDTTFFLEPQCRFLADALHHGRFPLWNTFCYCGMPQAPVTFPSLFYIPDFLLVLLPFSAGLACSMILHQSLAAIGMYLLLRSFNLCKLPAIGGALIYSLSGYMFCLSSNHSLISGVAWSVLALWSMRHVELAGPPRRFFPRMLLATICIAMLILSGRPEINVPGMMIVVGYMLCTAWARFRKSKKLLDPISLWQLRALFLGITLSLPEVLPVAEWLAVSRRAAGLQLQEVFLYSAHWYDLLAMVIGPCLGDLRLHGAQFRPLVSAVNLPAYVSCVYVGPVAATLFLIGACDSKWRARFGLLVFLAITLVAATGDYTPIVPFLVKVIPGLGFVRFPVKLLFLSIGLIAIFAARGYQCLIERRAPYLVPAAVWFLFGLWSVSLELLAGNRIVIMWFADLHRPFDLMLRAQSLIGDAGVIAAASGILLCAIVFFVNRNKLSVDVGRFIFTAAIVISLAAYAFQNERFGADPQFWEKPSMCADKIRQMQAAEHTDPKSRVFHLCIERFTVPPAYLPADQRGRSIADFQYDRETLKPDSNIDFGIPAPYGFEGTMVGDYFYAALHAYLESDQSLRPELGAPTDLPLARMCAITSTSCVLTQMYRTIGQPVPTQLLDPHYFQVEYENRAMNVRIYRVLCCLPRCYITHRWQWTEHNSLLDGIESGALNGFAPWNDTAMERRNANDPLPPSDPKAEIADRQDVSTIIQDDPECVTINVAVTRPSFLVLADQLYAGWEARIDSQPVPLYAANGFTRGVFVPSGHHTVQFRFEPGSLKLGIALFALGLILIIYLGFIDLRAAKSEPAKP